VELSDSLPLKLTLSGLCVCCIFHQSKTNEGRREHTLSDKCVGLFCRICVALLRHTTKLLGSLRLSCVCVGIFYQVETKKGRMLFRIDKCIGLFCGIFGSFMKYSGICWVIRCWSSLGLVIVSSHCRFSDCVSRHCL